ncbi:MAG: rod shape-determining protein MreD [Pseudomonadota bacterium]|jgi:rod shape-determining protein MreD
MMDRENILLPVSPGFIAFSLLAAFFLNLFPWGGWSWVPDFVALTLVFWSIYQPRKVGIGIAFLMGLVMDVHSASLLGENALAYTLLSYFAITIHRRVLWFRSTVQALHVLPLLLVMQVVQVLVQLAVTGKTPGWSYFMQSFVSTAVWPIVCWLLLAPQRRAVDRDDTRPI